VEDGKPSRTAFSAAGHRALHQTADKPVLFKDPWAFPILGPPPAEPLDPEKLAQHAANTASMRALIVARSLLAEGTLAAAVADGVDQYVLLGAGLDTFAYRNPYPSVRVFEVDYEATGRWKQAQLTAAGVAIPANVTYAAINFETETLAEALARAGFDLARPAVFAWLGVIPYLTREAIETTLKAVGSLAKGTQIIFDYGEPRETLPAAVQERMKERMAHLAAIGEPWLSFFAPDDMAALLTTAGFTEIEDLAGAQINARWYADRQDGLRAYPMAHVLRARV
jgi:methyltransferase (TIGR00027 family)